MANSCIPINTPAFIAKVKQYGTSASEMKAAIQSWLSKGNQWTSETEQGLKQYLDEYFKLNEKVYPKGTYESARQVWQKYNDKTYNTFEEGKVIYDKLSKMFKNEDLRLFEDLDGNYKIHITKPISNIKASNLGYTPEMQAIKEKAIKDGTFMKAPNGNPTNLTEKQWLQVRTKAFKNWFGDWENSVIFTANNVDDIEELKKKYPSSLPNKFYHHSTNKFGNQAYDHREGTKQELHIIGRLTTDKVDVLVVENPNSDNKIAHITLATAEGVRPVESNTELQRNQDKIQLLDDYVDTTFSNNLKNNVSKVVDENGEPLVVYHHTDNSNLAEFSTDFDNYFAKDGGTKEAIFFDENKTGTLNRKYDIPVFLNIKDLHEYNETKEQLHQRGTTYRQVVNESAAENNTDGGVHMKNFDDNKMEHQSIWIVHNSNQIKSATDNIGSFSRENNNIYYQKDIHAELEKLKHFKALKSMGSLNNIKSRLKNVVDVNIANAIVSAIEMDNSLLELDPYTIFQKIYQVRDEQIAQDYNDYIQQKVDKKLEEHLINYLKQYNIDYDDFSDFAKEHGVAGLYDILGKTIHVAKEEDRNKLTVPEEFAHAFVELMGSVVKKNTDKFPENKDYTFLFQNVENTSIYKQVYEQYKDVYTTKDGEPDINKIKKEAIGQALAVAITKKWENLDEQDSTFWQKLKEWFKAILNKFKNCEYLNFQTLVNTIAEEVVNNDNSRLKKINDDNYKLLDYSETIANQNKKDGGKALEFMKYFTSIGNIITGSLSYRAQGTVYRGKLDSLHDIDMIIPYNAHGIDFNTLKYKQLRRTQFSDRTGLVNELSKEKYFKDIKEKYPKIHFIAGYDSADKSFITVNAVYSEDESLSEKFASLTGSYASRLAQFTEEERDKMYLFDFFLKNKGVNTDYIVDEENNLKLASFDTSFKEKQFSMGRAKDIYDYQMWKLFDKFKKSYIPKEENLMYQQPANTINIYAGTNENADLSNFAERHFYPTSSFVKGNFKTVEGAFQAQKLGMLYNTKYASPYTGEAAEILEKLENATGAEAKAIGRTIQGLNKTKWDEMSSVEMRDLIRNSFEQNPQALQRLLATGNATLTHTQDKSKWGTEFPKLLMQIREELKKQYNTTENSAYQQSSQQDVSASTKSNTITSEIQAKKTIASKNGQITLTNEQKDVVNEVSNFIENRLRGKANATKPFITIKGAAGTGKTTVVKYIIEKLKKDGYNPNIAVAALSNKAVHVLEGKLKNYGVKKETLYTLAGANPNASEDQFAIDEDKSKLPIYDLIFVDEASMVGPNIFEQFSKYMEQSPYTSIVFLGDYAQLRNIPKKGEVSKKSPIFTSDKTEIVSLTERIRQGENSPILKYADNFREISEGKSDESVRKFINGTTVLSKDGAVIFENSSEVLDDKILNLFKKAKETNNKDFVKVVVGRNERKDAINRQVHNALFPNSINKLCAGDVIFFDAPYGEQIDNADDAKVINIGEEFEDNYGVSCRYIYITKDGNPLRIKERLNNFKSNITYDTVESTLYSRAKSARKGYESRQAWAEYWAFRGSYAKFSMGYAITTHKAQGSTYDITVIDVPDILGVSGWSNQEKAENIYTALTRSRNISVVLNRKDTNNNVSSILSVNNDIELNKNSDLSTHEPLPAPSTNQADAIKAPEKASISNKFIGYGVEGSSTNNYEKTYSELGRANVGNYSSYDVVFVSINGERSSQKEETEKLQDKTIKEALKALRAGAILVTDSESYTANSKFNTGEKKLAEALKNAGATYETYEKNKNIGLWVLKSNHSPIEDNSNNNNEQSSNNEESSKLEDARQKIANLKESSKSIIHKDSNSHKYYLVENGKQGKEITKSVTTLKSTLNPDYKEDDNIPEEWKYPSGKIGDVNDDIMRGFFSQRDPNNKNKTAQEIKNDTLAKVKTYGIINEAQFNTLWDKANKLTEQISKYVGDTKWECTTDEIPLLMKYNGEYVAGTPDMIVWNNKGEFFVFDFKTSRSAVDANKLKGWATQIFTYGNMMNIMSGINIKGGKAIVTTTYYPAPSTKKNPTIFSYVNSALGVKDYKGNITMKVQKQEGKEKKIFSLTNYNSNTTDFGAVKDATGVFGNINIENIVEPSRLDKSHMQAVLKEVSKNSSEDVQHTLSATAMEGNKNEIENIPTKNSETERREKENLSLKSIPVEERKMLADYIMHSVGFWLDIIESKDLQPEDNISLVINDCPKLEGDFNKRKTKLEAMSRLEIINTLGLTNILNMIKESEFSEENNPQWESELTEDIRQKYKIAYNNFKELCNTGYQKLLTLEKISPQNTSNVDLSFFEGDESLQDNADISHQEEDSRESWQVHFRNQSAIASLSSEIRRLYENLENGTDKYGYGLTSYVEPYKAITITQKLLRQCNTMPEMEQILRDNVKNYPWLETILEAIKEKDKYNPIRHKFYQNFRKDFTIYSVITPRYDMESGTIKYDVYKVNTKGAEKSIIDEAEIVYSIGMGQKLFKVNASKIVPNTTEIANLRKKLQDISAIQKAGDKSEEFLNNVQNTLYEVLKDIGISDKILTLNIYNNIIERHNNKKGEKINFLKSLYSRTNTILNKAEGKLKIKESPFDDRDFSNNFYALAKLLAEDIDEYTESSTYENGKMYYSYCNPSYMGKLIRNLSNMNNEKFNTFMEEQYGQYEKFFKSATGKYMTEWLYLFNDDALDSHETNFKAREALQHKVELSFDKQGYKEYDPSQMTLSLMMNFFKNESTDRNNPWAWFRVPIYANKPSLEFIRFARITDNCSLCKDNNETYKEHILNGLYGTFQQELVRMRTVLEMALNENSSERKASFIKSRNLKDSNIPEGMGINKESGEITGLTLDVLRSFIESNNKTPNGCNFKYLDTLNNIILNDYKPNTDEYKLQKYILEKLQAGFDNMTKGKSVDEVTPINSFHTIIENWLNEKYKETRKEWTRLGVLDTVTDKNTKETLYVHLSNSAVTGDEKSITVKDVDEALENYFWNDFYATLNIIQLTVGDMSYYKNIEDFQKRYAQLHAPTLKVDEYAVDFNGKPVAKQELRNGMTTEKSYHRTIYIADDIVESDIIPNVSKAFDIVIAKAKEHERPLLEAQKDKILELFKEINVADAQGYTSPTAYRKLKYMSGEWTEEMEDAYIKLMQGDFDISNTNLLMQPLKPFVYTQIPKNTGAQTVKKLPVPIQNKNSEYVLMLSYAVMKGAGVEGSRISAIYDFMEESAYDGRELKNGKPVKEGVYNGRGIDTIQFESAVKSGLQGIIDLNDTKDHKMTYEEVKNKLKAYAYANGDYNTSYVHEIPFEDYGEQQAVPDHFQDHEQPMGSQIRILDVADIENTDEEIYEYKGEKISGKKLREIYFNLQSDNIEYSIKELEKEFLLTKKARLDLVTESIKGYDASKKDSYDSLKRILRGLVNKNAITADFARVLLNHREDISNIEDFSTLQSTIESIANKEGINLEVSKKERNAVMSSLLREEVLNDQRYGSDMLEAVSLTNGEFNIPLCDASQSQRIQRLLNSIIKKRVNKQNIKGGPVVQASVYGSSKDLKIKFKKKDGKPLMSYSEFLGDSTKEHSEQDSKDAYIDYINKEQGGLDYFEIYITCPSKELEELLISKSTDKIDYMSNPEQAERDGIIPKGMLDMIGYRIPTEDKYSMQPCRVKGFLPRSAGEVVMLPKEITLLSGSDFDIDKLYVMTKSFIYDSKSKTFKLNNYGSEKRNNDLLDLQWSVLTNQNTLPKMFNPGSFEMQRDTTKRLEVMELVNSGKLKELEGITWENLKTMKSKELDAYLSKAEQKNILFCTTQVYFHKQNMTAGKLIGIFANNNTSHAFVNIHNDFTTTPIQLNPENIHSNFIIDSKEIGGTTGNLQIDGLYAEDNITLISKIMASYLAASVDAVKDPVLDKMNINNITAGPAMVLTRLGFSPDTVGLILKQPIIFEILNKFSVENRISYTSLKDVIEKEIKDRKIEMITPQISSDTLSKCLGKSVAELNNKDNKAVYGNAQDHVLLLMRNLLYMSEDFNELTLCTKFNSMSNTVGPLIADTLVTKARVDRFQKKCKDQESIFINAEGNIIPSIIEQNKMLNSFYKTFDEVSTEMFDGYFPHYSRTSFNDVLNTLIQASPNERGLSSDIITKFENYFAAYKFAEEGIIDFNKDYYLSEKFVKRVEALQNKPELKDNALMSLLREKKDGKYYYINIEGGGLSAEQQQTIKDAWASLLEYQDVEIRNFAIELAKYFVFRGGFGFNPKTVMHLMPNAVKSSIERYNELMTTWNLNDPFTFMSQFVRNIAGTRLENRVLTRIKPAPNIVVENNTISIPKNKIGYKPNMFIAYKDKVGIEGKLKDDNYVFTLVSQLGSNNNYIEFDTVNNLTRKAYTNNETSDNTIPEYESFNSKRLNVNDIDFGQNSYYVEDNNNKGNDLIKDSINAFLKERGIC